MVFHLGVKCFYFGVLKDCTKFIKVSHFMQEVRLLYMSD